MRKRHIAPYGINLWAMRIKPSLEKTKTWRVVPIHSHIIEQGPEGQRFLDYVAARAKAKKLLFYEQRGPVSALAGSGGNKLFNDRAWVDLY